MTPGKMQRIGKYQIVREIGSGGFGSVYLAFDPGTERQVAVKVLRTPQDPSLLARFRGEARAAAALQHPNIVTIYEAGEDQDLHYLAMEYVDGRTVKDLMVQRDPLPLWRKVDIMSQVAEGLDCAHRHNVVHRDVKPANIMVRNDNGLVKILDFGIARLVQGDATRLTQSGFLIGTIGYMAPEQFEEGEGDALCDLWAYGVVYYELLTGRHPFGAEDTAPFRLMNRIREQEAAPVSSLVADCPGELDRVLARLLAKKREDRYQSFADVQLDVQPLLVELKKRHASGLAARAGELIAAGEFEGATNAIRTILSLDPGNAAVTGVRERLQQAQRQRTRRSQVDVLVQVADAESGKGRLAEAMQALEKAQSIDPENTLVSTRIESLRAAQRQAELTRRLVAEARRQLEASNLTEAFKAATGASSADPQDAEAAALLKQIRGAIEQRERQRNFERNLAKARGLVAIQSFEDALALLEELNAQFPGAAGVAELIQQARRQKDERDRREKLAAGIAAARSLIRRPAMREAAQALEALTGEYPGEREPAELLAYVRQELAAQEARARAEAIAGEAQALAEKLQFDGALQLLERSIQTYPGEECLPRTIRLVLARRAEYDRERAFEDGMARARKMAGQGAFEEALGLAAALEHDYPDRREVRSLREEFLQGQAARRRVEIEDLLAQSAAREKAGDLQAAVRILEDGLKQHPDVAELRTAAESLRKCKAEDDKQRALASACAEIERLLGDGQVPAAREALNRARRVHGPNPRLDGLLQKVEQADLRRNQLSAAEKQMRERAFSQAEENLTALLRMDSQDADARTMLDSLGRMRAEEDRRQQAAAEAQANAARELERQRALAAGRAEAGRLLAARDFPAAIQLYQALIAQFPNDPLLPQELGAAQAAGQRAERDQQSARQELDRQQAVAAGCAEARRLLAGRQFDAAIRIYQGLLARFPNDPLASEDLRAAYAARDRINRGEMASRGRAEAAGLLRNQDFENALRRYQELRNQFPEDTQLHYDYEAAVAAKEEFERKQALAAGRADAQRLLAQRKFEAAIQRYQLLMVQFPNDPLLPDELRDAHLAKSRSEQKEQIARGRADAAGLLRGKQFDRAVALLESLVRQFPDAPELGDELREARAVRDETLRRQTVQRALSEAERLATAGSLDEAIRRYEALLKEYPDDAAVRDGLAGARNAKSAADRKQAYQRALAEAERLATAGSLDDAIRRYEALLKEHPDDAAVRDGLAGARNAKSAADRKQAYQRGRTEAERLARNADFAAAIRTLEDLLKQFPGDRALADDLQLTRKARDLREQRIQMDGRIAQLEKLRADGDAAGVKKEAERLLSEREEPRARALLEWADASLAGPQAARPARRKLTWLWAALPALALAALGVLWWRMHPPPAADSLDVTPQKVSFTWIRGTPPPDPKTITVRAKGGAAQWVASTEQDWLTANATGSSQVKIAINTAKFESGGTAEYSGLVKISGGGIDRWVNVALSVSAESKPDQPVEKAAPELTVTPPELTFRWKPSTPPPGPKTVFIQSHGAEVRWKFSRGNVAWIGVAPSKDQTQLVVTVNPSRAAGIHNSEQLLISSGDSIKQVQVNLEVESPAVRVKGTAPPPVSSPTPAAEPPKTEAVNCHSPDYIAAGRDNGKLVWKGELAPGATLWLARDLSWRDAAGPSGAWQGKALDRLPGCAVGLAIAPAGLTALEEPRADNGFGRLRLKNDSGSTITSITVTWNVN